MHYQELITDFISASGETLCTNLVGIYLHGSLAMGCFNPAASDIDIIAVIDGSITDEKKLKFMERVVKLNEHAPAKGIEVSVVKREYCKPFVYPTPYELHFSPMHLKRFSENPKEYVKNMKGTDRDLAAHFTIINKYGIVLYGEPISDVFGEVPVEDYADSIVRDIENARYDIIENPVYVTLNLCRVLAFLKDELYLSKEKGGEWGLKFLPEAYRSLVSQALSCYKTGQHMTADADIAKDFATFMLNKIKYLTP